MTKTDETFDAFVHARLPALLRFAHAVTGDPHTAADLVQDALERTGMRWSKLDRLGDPEAYVRRAIINGRRSRWRKHHRETLVAALPDKPTTADDDGLDRDELWQLVRALPNRQRAIIVLRYYEDLSEAQIAATLGCSPGTVKSQANKAISKLRQAMQATPPAPTAEESPCPI